MLPSATGTGSGMSSPLRTDRVNPRPDDRPIGPFAVPAFVRLWSASVASHVGTQMNNVAKVWLLWELTHSPFALGVEGLCFAVPMTVLPLLGGTFADRLDRLRIVRVTLVVEAAQAVALAVVAAAGQVQPWMLYLAAGLDATRLAFNIPAQASLLPRLVPPEILQPALALSSATWSSSALVGPALGGALIAVSGSFSVFVVNAASTLAALLALRGLGSLPPESAEEVGAGALPVGLSFLRAHRRVLDLQWVLLLSMAAILGVETLLPVFAERSWHVGAVGYGVLRTAPGIAAVLAGLAVSGLRTRLPGPHVLPSAVVGAAVALAGFAASPPFAAALVLLAVSSWLFTAVQILSSSEIQRRVPDGVRGRVNAMTAVGQNGLAGLVAVGTSGAAGHVGPGWAVAGLAVLVAVTAVPVLLRNDPAGT